MTGVGDDDRDADVVDVEVDEGEPVERLPGWLVPLAVAAVALPILVVGAWSTFGPPDVDAWGRLKCRVEAERVWPATHPHHDVVYERCIERLP